MEPKTPFAWPLDNLGVAIDNPATGHRGYGEFRGAWPDPTPSLDRFQAALREFCDALGIPEPPAHKIALARNAWRRLDETSRDE